MTRIALLTPRFTSGDAVCNDIAGMQDILSELGHDVRIFADGGEGDREFLAVRKLRGFIRDPSDILIYHYSIAWETALALFRELNCRKVLKYHNVTPPEFFEPYHAGIANACRVGLTQLGEFIRAGCDLGLAASEFNSRDLIREGLPAEQTRVMAPLHRVDDLLNGEADAGALAEFAMDYPRDFTNILMVGRLAPNKGYENLIRAFALYRDAYNPDSRLLIVGRSDPQLDGYYRQLNELMDRLDVREDVIFTGGVTQSELKSMYLSARVFMTLSEHEGFCVPLVEAMAMKLPVIALGRAGVPETAGDGALVWNEPDPALFAASIHRIVSDPDLAFALANRGHARFRGEFNTDRIKGDFLQALEPLLS